MNEKPLIAVMSCERDSANGCHDAIRRTWVQHLVEGIAYKIFVGRGTRALALDEVRLDVEDDYPHLPEKSQALRKWAKENGYDFVFKADRDTFISPRRLLASGFENYDYFGHFPCYSRTGYIPALDEEFSTYCDARGVYPYASGGCGYWTSPKANEIIINAPMDWRRLDNKGNPAEDLMIPNLLMVENIRGFHDPRFIFKGDRLNIYGYEGISVHLSRGTGSYEPSWMDICYQLSKGAL